MACYKPLAGWRGPGGLVGLRAKRNDHAGRPVTVGCGQCWGCRLEYSRQWAFRLMCECQLYSAACFITLTFDPEHYPPGGSINVQDIQTFMRSLRYHVGERCDSLGIARHRLRYFAVGEYGDRNGRPHYHLCLFNWDFRDDRVVRAPEDGKEKPYDVYGSELLDAAWGKGRTEIGALNFESAAYCARYILKKVNGDLQEDHYKVYDDDGNVFHRKPEFVTMSRGSGPEDADPRFRGGIGHGWYHRYKNDLFNQDSAVMRGHETRVPRYFDKLLEKEDPERLQEIKQARMDAPRDQDDETPERLQQREAVAKARAALFLKRKL